MRAHTRTHTHTDTRHKASIHVLQPPPRSLTLSNALMNNGIKQFVQTVPECTVICCPAVRLLSTFPYDPCKATNTEVPRQSHMEPGERICSEEHEIHNSVAGEFDGNCSIGLAKKTFESNQIKSNQNIMTLHHQK